MSSVGLASCRARWRLPARPGFGPGPLELAGLRRRYGRTVALDGLSFTIEPGRIFGFPGPTGAGKTTAMRIVMGIEQPDEGAVR